MNVHRPDSALWDILRCTPDVVSVIQRCNMLHHYAWLEYVSNLHTAATSRKAAAADKLFLVKVARIRMEEYTILKERLMLKVFERADVVESWVTLGILREVRKTFDVDGGFRRREALLRLLEVRLAGVDLAVAKIEAAL